MNSLYVVIAFHYVEERLKYLNDVLESLEIINKKHKVKVIVQTNEANQLLQQLVTRFGIEIQIEEINNLIDPYKLTWCHKCRMFDFLREESFTHFAYLEDDMELTLENFEYWIETRKLFKGRGFNFIPGFVRVERNVVGDVFAVDITRRVEGAILEIPEGKFISITQPYQGMFVMDRKMVTKHIESPAFQLETSRPLPNAGNDVRERANQGNMYTNVPSGFQHRLMIPLNNERNFWILHNAGNYHNMPGTLHGKLLTHKIFEGLL